MCQQGYRVGMPMVIVLASVSEKVALSVFVLALVSERAALMANGQ